ncbi:MAG: NERD domain-containing protein [Acidobacteria bacterium]|nr:NERD domain-containing protein [Acidobacteriota bacterium]
MTAMSLRYAGACRECGTALPAGTMAEYDRATKTVVCVTCSSSEVDEVATVGDVAIESGVAGASAQREFEKRKTKRETRIRTAHPHLGGLMLALSDEPQSTRAWATGARGEVVLGARLDKLRERGISVLHDRRIPGTKANIDHIAVGPRGVFVIDAKKYTGGPSLRVEGGLFRPRTESLIVGSRDQTKLVHGVQRQVSLVESALRQAGFQDVPSYGMMCFVEGDWPLLGGTFFIGAIEVLWPKKAVERVTSPGAFTATDSESIARALARQFPPA